jgi:hypothetical protein
VKDLAESRYNIPVSINELTRVFDSPRFRVQAALAHGLDKSPDNEESISPSIKIVNSKSSTGFNRMQNKIYQSREEKSWIILRLNSRSNLLEDG